ncbi:PLDc N-terminal domain-containing protein [Formosa sp. PL04]|uniref:PLDc N-terminal domain-containing protein n=1 Tax=Formosa sp. PL04 TaxID=3081755 RepID=UPI0029817F01|nr:PLDc N-terminal domain-containing protein [Formosa sp. PL04]MDW5290279.1 PLDc N-terminal domain-containing protein [Formosa sp. PL04]
MIKVVLISILLTLIITLINLIDIFKSKLNGNDKFFWVFVVLFFNLIGIRIYFFTKKQNIKRINQTKD